MSDPVNRPAHYTQGEVECIDAIAAAVVNLKGEDAYCTAAAIKYLWRWQAKGGVEDLRKCQWYINRMISRQVGGGDAGLISTGKDGRIK